MFHEAANLSPTMKSVRKLEIDRFFGKRPKEKGRASRRDSEDERKETLVILAIALLFVANVVLYLCHHYGLTS